MRKVAWSAALVIISGVIAYSQYENYASPSYTEMPLDAALVQYIERFDDDYLSQPEKDSLKSLINDSFFVGLEHGGSRLHWATPDEYGVYLDTSLFNTDNRNSTAATESLESTPDNSMLILTLIHENQHRRDLEVMGTSLLSKHEEEPVESFAFATLLEYFGYKKEFEVLTRWHERHEFPLPQCKINNGGAWLNINTEEMTAVQYGFGMAMNYFFNGMAPHADKFLPNVDKQRLAFRGSVRQSVLSEVKRSSGDLHEYSNGLLGGMLQCPAEGFPNK